MDALTKQWSRRGEANAPFLNRILPRGSLFSLTTIMIWPHKDSFPFKQQIVIVSCAMSALVAALLPGLSWVQRVTSPLAVLICFLLSYFFVRIVLAVLGLVRPVGKFYGFFVFYGMLVACVTFVVLFPVIVFDPEISDPGKRAYIVVCAVPGAMGACAAVLATFRRWGAGG